MEVERPFGWHVVVSIEVFIPPLKRLRLMGTEFMIHFLGGYLGHLVIILCVLDFISHNYGTIILERARIELLQCQREESKVANHPSIFQPVYQLISFSFDSFEGHFVSVIYVCFDPVYIFYKPLVFGDLHGTFSILKFPVSLGSDHRVSSTISG